MCPSCGGRFYDLNRNPIECPKCETTFEPKAIARPARAAVEKIPAPAVAKSKASDEILAQAKAINGDDDDDDDDIDLDVDIDVDDDDDDDSEDKGVLEDASDLTGGDDGVPNIREQATEGTPDDR